MVTAAPDAERLQLEFAKKKFKKWCEDEEAAKKALGELVARAYARRIAVIRACKSRDDLGKMPQFRFHALKGNRKGHYSIDLDYKFRLIITFPEDSNTKVRIEEVSNHDDD